MFACLLSACYILIAFLKDTGSFFLNFIKNSILKEFLKCVHEGPRREPLAMQVCPPGLQCDLGKLRPTQYGPEVSLPCSGLADSEPASHSRPAGEAAPRGTLCTPRGQGPARPRPHAQASIGLFRPLAPDTLPPRCE